MIGDAPPVIMNTPRSDSAIVVFVSGTSTISMLEVDDSKFMVSIPDKCVCSSFHVSETSTILGEWDASRIDEDRLAQKLGSGKAAKMLGITEDQVQTKER